jgi:hypothetical protein
VTPQSLSMGTCRNCAGKGDIRHLKTKGQGWHRCCGPGRPCAPYGNVNSVSGTVADFAIGAHTVTPWSMSMVRSGRGLQSHTPPAEIVKQSGLAYGG